MLASIGVWTRRNRGGGFSLPSSFHRGQVRFSLSAGRSGYAMTGQISGGIARTRNFRRSTSPPNRTRQDVNNTFWAARPSTKHRLAALN